MSRVKENGPMVVMFDQSLNSIIKHKQVDD